jgi:hypothetical protein
MSRLPPVAALLLLLATLVLGACGGGSSDIDEKNAYVRELNAAQADFQVSASRISNQRIPTETSGKIKLVQRLEGAVDEVVGTLKDIDVPGDVRVEHQQLIDAMTGFRGDVRKLTQTYRGGNTHKLPAAIDAFKTAQTRVNTRIDATIAAINSKLAAS